MSLNIKNEETHQLVRKLADELGESQAEAVRVAVVEKLERLERRRGKGVAERLMEIGREFRAEWGDEPFPDHAELLYDETGLPK